MAPIIYEINNEHSELVRNFLESKKISYKIKNLEKKLQNLEGNKKDILTMYFSIPNENGDFRIEHSKEADDGRIYYKIEHKKNSNYGKLFYISGMLDKRAINCVDSYLKPVCNIENCHLDLESFNKIELIEPGEVYLSNDKWRINPDKKVKIKLIKK